MVDDLITEIIEQIEAKIINYRRDFHHYPELGWQEFRTASLIAQRLNNLGYQLQLGKEVVADEARMGVPDKTQLNEEYQRALKQGASTEFIDYFKDGYTGIVASIEKGHGPTIGLRFDIDALGVEESKKESHLPTRLGFSSTIDNVMHSCGHDGHIAMGLGVAEVLSQLKDELQGKVKLIFQPAEEGVRGAKAMAKAGVVDDVDYMFGIHLGMKAGSGHLACGTKGFLATSKIDAIMTGKPAHAGGEPEVGQNALLAAATAVTNLYSIPRHSKGATRINVGRLRAGTGRNVIPANAKLVIETRGETSELNNYMADYAHQVLVNAAQMHDVSLKVKAMGGADSGCSSPKLSQQVKKIAQDLGCFDHLIGKGVSLGGSEDFTYFMNRVQDRGGQATYMMLGSDLKGSHHTSEFDFNEADLKKGIRLLANLVFEIGS